MTSLIRATLPTKSTFFMLKPKKYVNVYLITCQSNFVSIAQVSTSKPNAKKDVFLVLTQSGVVTIRRQGDKMGKVTRYSYVQIESAVKVNDNLNLRR